ncbi:RAD protein (Pv-fam-e) [Plasmodium vivax]|uniref:RAD protein (Pv-fam-e) n=5 Tax=Plasmodium vivax TaxID=5855 RepID=A5K601_PLAVS|nr:RAD protein (Pv-fam-e) [Plasmodium vivax]EDL45336.1 RAD protein (Pv-fam-e) [Plasmodium vivax]KMZ94585.1 RAD protein (Pv-fam-e) [Plasmodium vivax Mauritania I]KNA01125.1 RAD protein (Pv-fam-e) [Plasmodium vivax North Korean]|eukprot:XP_001615063.1 RAD protein (Pv-fam-e) [Plasmodium vivax Sal-1]
MKIFYKLAVPVVAFSSFTLPNVMLTHNSGVLNGSASLQRGVEAYQRGLGEPSFLENDYITQVTLQDYHAHDNKPITKVRCITQDEYRCLLTEIQVLKKIISSKKYNLFISSGDMETLLRGYNNVHSATYNKLINKLFAKLNEVASGNAIKERDKIKLWRECKDSIAKEFNEINDHYKRMCDSYMVKNRAMNIGFKKILYKYVKSWEEAIRRNEKKWGDIFLQRTRKGKAAFY